MSAHEPKQLISLLDALPTHCRFISGNPRTLLICGARAVPGKPYCADHYRLTRQREKAA